MTTAQRADAWPVTDADIRRRGHRLRGRVYAALAITAFLYVLVHGALVSAFGPERLYDLLGERTYNALIPVGGPVLAAALVAAVALVDGLFGVLRAVARLPLRLVSAHWPAARRRVAEHAGSVLLVVAGVVAWPLLVTGSPVDHLAHLSWHLFAGAEQCEDTAYAPGFSEWGFRRVTPGMTLAEVVALIGEPLDRRELDGGRWSARWTRSPGDTHFWRRSVTFGRDDRVVERYDEFYVD